MACRPAHCVERSLRSAISTASIAGPRGCRPPAVSRAQALGRPGAFMTFEPHPRAFFNPGEPLFRLTDEAAKLRLLASTGLDGAFVLTFDAALARLTADEFVARILVGRFGISGA